MTRWSQPNRPRWGKIIALYLLVVAVYAVIFSVWQVESLPGMVHFLGVLIFATCLLPFVRWYQQGRVKLPMFELIALSYAAQYSLPLYTQLNGVVLFSQFVPSTWQALTQALWLVEIGIMAMIAGYVLVQRSPLMRLLPSLDLPFTPERRANYIRVAFVIGGAAMLLNATNFAPFRSPTFGALARLFTAQLYLAIILLTYQVYGGQAPKRSGRAVLYVAVGLALALGLVSGMLENALAPVVMYLVARWHASRRFPWQLVIGVVLLFLVLNPVKIAYRNQYWAAGTSYGLGERLSTWTELTAESASSMLKGGFTQDTADNLSHSLARLDLVHKFAYVRAATPQLVPFYRGETYSYFLLAWIPRVLWPDKPTATANANDRMDVDYQLKMEGQQTTVGIGLLPESYANFGVWGVPIIMALQGAVFAFVSLLLNGPRSDGGHAIYLYIMVYFLNGIGSSASVLFGAILQKLNRQCPDHAPVHQWVPGK